MSQEIIKTEITELPQNRISALLNEQGLNDATDNVIEFASAAFEILENFEPGTTLTQETINGFCTLSRFFNFNVSIIEEIRYRKALENKKTTNMDEMKKKIENALRVLDPKNTNSTFEEKQKAFETIQEALSLIYE